MLKALAVIGSVIIWKVISLKAIAESVSEFDWYLAGR